MQQIDFSSWKNLEAYVHQLQLNVDGGVRNTGVSKLLFRGQGNAEWTLQSSLERQGQENFSVLDYYRLVLKAKAQLETFAKHDWSEIDYKEVQKLASDYDLFSLSDLPAYELLAFLRHHGFPSPLLDWTRSLYVAAFFAYQRPSNERISVYMFQERTGQGKVHSSEWAQIRGLGPHVRSHPRHFLQQSQYTISIQFVDGRWIFVPHESPFARESNHPQDLLWKLTAPASDRIAVLRHLDTYNLNEFSLFQSEEALLATIGLRELHLSK